MITATVGVERQHAVVLVIDKVIVFVLGFAPLVAGEIVVIELAFL